MRIGCILAARTNTFATSMTPAEGLLSNCLILLFLVYIAVLNRVDLDYYIYSIQEDQSLEWATFWALTVRIPRSDK